MDSKSQRGSGAHSQYWLPLPRIRPWLRLALRCLGNRLRETTTATHLATFTLRQMAAVASAHKYSGAACARPRPPFLRPQELQRRNDDLLTGILGLELHMVVHSTPSRLPPAQRKAALREKPSACPRATQARKIDLHEVYCGVFVQ